jgi:myo-inositol 2-dehydrogenase/D-chiro-inositol 1-dehydrogenase
MPGKQVVAGLIGAGRIGKMHAENIVCHLPDVFLKGVADPNLDENWAGSLRIPVQSRNEDAILNDSEIEAVVIAAASTSHVALIKAAAQKGKQIFCEKPIAFDPDTILEAILAARKADVRLQVGFNRRFDANFIRVRDVVRSGQIGTPHIIHVTSRDPARPTIDYVRHSGGLYKDFCIHDFDMIRFVSNVEVEEVYATGSVMIDPAIGEAGDIDTALITLKMTNGALCLIDVSRETNYGYDQRLEVFGSKGSIIAQNATPTRTVHSTADGVFTETPHYSFIERYKEAYVFELREFFDCVQNQKDPSVVGEDVLEAIKIAEAAGLSHTQNKSVRIVT